MNEALERRVRERAGARCEYCGLPESISRAAHAIDHIIARQHRGPTTLDNLALACIRCNLNKGPNIASLDPMDGGFTRLYHPRRDRWSDHFAVQGALLVGLTPIGRATVSVLAMNEPLRFAARQALIDEGAFRPPGE